MPPWVIVIVVMAGLAALVAFALWVPVDVTVRVDADGMPRFGLRFLWLFGLVSKELPPARRKAREKPEAKLKRVTRRKPALKRAQKGVRSLLALLRTGRLAGKLMDLVKEVFPCVQFRELRVNLRIGLDNPADTGLLFAVIAPVNFIPSSRNREVRVQPAFEDAVFEGYAEGTLRLRPIRLIPSFAKFALSPTSISAIIKLARINAK